MLKLVLGVLGGVLMILSGLVHSSIGWRELRKAFTKANVPNDLVVGLAVPWHFAGLAMVTFGALAILMLLRNRDDRAAMLVPLVIAGAYIVFGAIGLAAIKVDPTFLMFLVPGALLLIAAL
jgi:hypothetical protein